MNENYYVIEQDSPIKICITVKFHLYGLILEALFKGIIFD